VLVLSLPLIIAFLVCFLLPSPSAAQESSDYEEVVFGFTLKDLGSYNVSVAVKGDKVYLPVMELFNIFEVYYTIQGQNIITGTYLSSASPMMIDPVKRLITLEDKRYELTQEDIFRGDMDIYLSREKFEEVFGITTTVNMNRLQIMAETEKELPALARRRAAQERSRAESAPVVPVKYPLEFDRERSVLTGAVLDYDVSTSFSGFSSQGISSYTFTGGGEVAGGDLLGSLVGSTGQSPSFSDLRWRYVVRDNDYFSSVTAGQVSTGSSYFPSVTGIALSNEPVEPRVLFDNYVVDGYTEPESDVELYLNDRLVDFQRTNAEGYYRFQVPLTYGTMRVTVKTYSKYGDINVDEKQIQVPFSFVPEGVLTYNVQAGKAYDLSTGIKDVYLGNGGLLYGATDWLTLNGGLEQSFNSGLRNPIYYAGFSSRLFSQYIFDVDIAPNSYYRLDANAIFASNAGVYFEYAKYMLNDTLVGTTPQQTASLAVYVPLSFISPSTGFRLSEDYSDAPPGKVLSPRLDLSTRIAEVQLLMSYTEVTRDADVHPLSLAGTGLLTTTLMYTVPGGLTLPEFLRRLLLRSQITYSPQGSVFQDIGLQASKTFMQIFQLNLQLDRNMVARSTSVEAGLIMDLNITRESSVFNAGGGVVTSRHSLYGSLALDKNGGSVLLSNREESDKAGVDVVMFVDNNNDSVYDAGDELIPAKGIKVNGMGKIEVGRDSVIRVSELQSYFRYNLEVDRQQIDPNLVPMIDKFSFVTDPNQFKRIEIPFYRGGTVSGTVYLEKEGKRTPLSGARIIMRSTDGAHGDTLHTFADGGFYSMDVAPDMYTLLVDPTQLQFLQAVQRGGPLSLTVHRSRDGDIIDTLEIVVEKLTPLANLQSEDTSRSSATMRIDTLVKQPAEPQKAVNMPAGPVAEVNQRAESRVPEIPEQAAKPDSTQVASRTETLLNEYDNALEAFRSRNYADAATSFQKILSENVADEVADHCHYWIGESEYAMKEYWKALKEFNEVLAFANSDKKKDAQFMIGMCYERLGNIGRAKEAFEKVVKSYPGTANLKDARLHLSRFIRYEDALEIFMSRKYSRAAAEFQQLLNEKVPDEIADHCHYWIGESKYGAKKYGEALRQFNVVLTFKGSAKKGDAQYMIARCYERMGNLKKAKEAFELVVRDYPTSVNFTKAKERLAKM
jgi:TolA-binding protein